jgi:hypothetical protein
MNGRVLWRRLVGVLVLSSITTPSAGAETALQVPVGPRAIAMGGAFCATADDATAMAIPVDSIRASLIAENPEIAGELEELRVLQDVEGASRRAGRLGKP